MTPIPGSSRHPRTGVTPARGSSFLVPFTSALHGEGDPCGPTAQTWLHGKGPLAHCPSELPAPAGTQDLSELAQRGREAATAPHTQTHFPGAHSAKPSKLLSAPLCQPGPCWKAQTSPPASLPPA